MMGEKRPIIIKKGMIIVCPLCRRNIGKFTRDVRAREVISEDSMIIHGRKLKKGDEMICPHCEFPFSVDTVVGAVIHTERGWLPGVVPEEPHGDWLPSEIEYFLKRKKRWKPEWDALRENLFEPSPEAG